MATLKKGEKIQILQTIILSTVLFLGVYFFHLDINVLEITATFFTVILLDYIFSNTWKLEKVFPFSWVNAGFGICFFLRSNDLILYILAWFIAILGKHLIRIHGRHFLNPSNMAVVFILTLFPFYAWVNTLQWGNYSTGNLSSAYIYMFSLLLILGSIITYFVYNTFHFRYFLDYTFPFLITHFLLFFIIPFSETLSSATKFFNISFFIFTFFMMSDPKTVPEKSSSRVLYAILLVLNFYSLQFYINEMYAILYALFLNTLFLPFIWYLEKYTYKKIPYSVFFLLFLNIVSSIVILLSMYKYWQPDLVFDNICVELFCK